MFLGVAIIDNMRISKMILLSFEKVTSLIIDFDKSSLVYMAWNQSLGRILTNVMRCKEFPY